MITVEHDHQRRLRIITAVGDVTGAEWLAALEQQAADGEWTWATLNDASAVTSAPTTDEVKRLRTSVEHFTSRLGRRGPVAFVMPAASALYGMARMYELTTDETQDVRVWHAREDAEVWLAARIP